MSIDTSAIYDQILALKIDLDFEDIPTPSYLQEKILECSDALRTIEKRIIEVTREMSSREKDLKLEQVRLDIKKRGILVNDAIIKKLPSAKERESAADEKLQADHERVLGLENDVMELQNLQSSIRLVHQNLKTTNSDIRVLMRIMEQQVYRLNIGSKDDKEMKELVSGLGEIEQLENELTLDDVESSSESIDSDKPDSRSEGAPLTNTGTASKEAGSESEDELDTISSFLSDDTDDIGDKTSALSEEGEGDEDGGSAQSTVDSEDAKEKNSVPASTEVAGNGNGGSSVTGLDLDLGDILGEPQSASTSSPPAKVTSNSSKSTKKETTSKAVSTPEKTAPSKDTLEVELDIDDILTSLS